MLASASVLALGFTLRATSPSPMVMPAMGVHSVQMMATSSIPAAAEPALEICREAARTKATDPEAVCEALLEVEQSARAAAKNDGGEISRATIAKLDGAWRLVFTTAR